MRGLTTLRRRTAATAVAVVAVLIVALATVLLTRPAASPSASPGGSASAIATLASPSVAPSPTAVATASPTQSPPSGEVYADLDGVATTAALAHQLPLAVMVDDNDVARPQAGLSTASIVYQAPADGGELRYMAIFQEGNAKDLGPVRSGRPYFVQWAAEYRALFGHYGGDAKTLQQVIPSLASSIYNMDALGNGGCPYHRVSTRVMPHNAYTNTASLRACATRLGYPALATATAVRAFSSDASLEARPASASISVPYPHQAVTYAYDRTTNSYRRSVDGRAQVDAANGKQVQPRNVVVMFQALSTDPDSEPGYARPVLASIGSGQAIVFRDGQAIKGTWQKASATALTRLYGADGAEIALVRGQVFIQVVATGTKVTYKAG